MEIDNVNEELNLLDEEEAGTMFFFHEDGTVSQMSQEEFGPKDLENTAPSEWSVQKIWNEMVNIERREPKVRDYISFGDIGKTDYWSRYMKMKGTPETNRFDERVLRIFQAGDEFHDLIKTVFKKAGIFINSQDDLDENGEEQWSIIEATDITLKQFGANDVLVGGVPNIERARKWIDESDLSSFAKQKAERIVDVLEKQFPNGLKPMIYEIKSVNSQAFWAKKGYLHEAYPHHRFQAYGYLKANHRNPKALEMVRKAGLNVDSIDEARLLYISKDDLVTAEFPILIGDKNLSEAYDKDIKTMSYYVLNDIEPPKPEYIVFNKRKAYSFQHNKIKYKVRGCYEINWEVIRSPYFELMTELEDKKQLNDLVKDELSEKNKTIKNRVLDNLGINIKKK